MLASSNVVAVANDKDGGFSLSLFDPEVLSMTHLQVLEIGKYFDSDWSKWDMRHMKAASAHINLTKRVGSLENEESIFRSLRNSMNMPSSSLAIVVTSCKSHKL